MTHISDLTFPKTPRVTQIIVSSRELAIARHLHTITSQNLLFHLLNTYINKSNYIHGDNVFTYLKINPQTTQKQVSKRLGNGRSVLEDIPFTENAELILNKAEEYRRNQLRKFGQTPDYVPEMTSDQLLYGFTQSPDSKAYEILKKASAGKFSSKSVDKAIRTRWYLN